uniref:Peptidase_M16_M domain-containing protein n=1 Tax=Ascaris lumbricoides TaxID=6252 RepID=A0A0M3HM35_ASCLU
TKAPENGTFYWVAGEKEADSFTQRDIDEERVLYAQLNMQAYQDSFEFALGNDQNDVIYNRSQVIILPVVKPQSLLVEHEEPEPITVSHLNATALEVDFLMNILLVNLNHPVSKTKRLPVASFSLK